MFRIWKKILRIIAIILPCFLAVFISNNVFAVSDYTYTINASNNGNFEYLCYNNEPSINRNCSDYNYLKIDFNGSSTSYLNSLAFNFSGNTNFTGSYTLYPSSHIIISLEDFNNNSNLRVIFINSGINVTGLSSGWFVDVTLTESITPDAPSGSITLTENGTYDVTSYAEAVVDVPATIVPGDYHDDLISIRNVIIIGAGVILVLYFFYCIYGIIIPTTGGKR